MAAKLAKTGVVGGFSRIVMLWRDGIYRWIGISLFVVAENWAAIQRLFTELAVAPLFASLAENLATSYGTVVSGLQELPSLAAWDARAAVTWSIIAAVAHILWYYKAWDAILRFKFASEVSKEMVLVTATPLYMALVWGWTGTVPVLGDMEAFQNLPELLEFEKLTPEVPDWMPFGGGENVTNAPANGSVNGTVNTTGN